MDQDLKDILETVHFIKEKVEQLPTEGRVREIVREVIQEEVPGIVALEVKDIRLDVKQIDKRLATLGELYANLRGVTKEIDDLRRQVRAIQKHLGLGKEIAA